MADEPTTTETSVAPATPATEGHPLQTSWAFWYDKKLTHEERAEAKAKGIRISYKDQLNKIGTFGTVEDFWAHYVHMKRPSELPNDSNVYLFRDGLFPSWETYPMGGCWILKVRKAVGVVGKLWQDLLFATIGELFEEPNVVGITMAIRSREDMVSVWNKDNFNPDTRFLIGDKLRRILSLEQRTMIEYKFHIEPEHVAQDASHDATHVAGAAPDRANPDGHDSQSDADVPEHVAQDASHPHSSGAVPCRTDPAGHDVQSDAVVPEHVSQEAWHPQELGAAPIRTVPVGHVSQPDVPVAEQVAQEASHPQAPGGPLSSTVPVGHVVQPEVPVAEQVSQEASHPQAPGGPLSSTVPVGHVVQPEVPVAEQVAQEASHPQAPGGPLSSAVPVGHVVQPEVPVAEHVVQEPSQATHVLGAAPDSTKPSGHDVQPDVPVAEHVSQEASHPQAPGGPLSRTVPVGHV